MEKLQEPVQVVNASVTLLGQAKSVKKNCARWKIAATKELLQALALICAHVNVLKALLATNVNISFVTLLIAPSVAQPRVLARRAWILLVPVALAPV